MFDLVIALRSIPGFHHTSSLPPAYLFLQPAACFLLSFLRPNGRFSCCATVTQGVALGYDALSFQDGIFPLIPLVTQKLSPKPPLITLFEQCGTENAERHNLPSAEPKWSKQITDSRKQKSPSACNLPSAVCNLFNLFYLALHRFRVDADECFDQGLE